jgi:Holliday junction resolvase
MLKIKQSILEALIDYLNKKGYKEFRSGLKGMDKPVKVKSSDGKTYSPDLVAIHKDSKYFFEIEIADEIDKEKFIEKCNTFARVAKEFDGKFNLVVPLENYDKVLQIINNNKLENIEIVQIKMN